MGNSSSPTGDIEAMAGTAAGIDSAGDVIFGQTEQDIYTFFSDTRRDVSENVLQYQKY